MLKIKILKAGRQGDVPFVAISGDLTELNNLGLETFPLDRYGLHTLVEGEGTAHCHALKDKTLETVFKNSFSKPKLTIIPKGTELQHYHGVKKCLTKEHNTITIPAGALISGTQREMDVSGKLRLVLD